ncbi:polyketide cyclase [Leekyejoonella antrihumi]|uniref:Polyketide cyclase n=2 Tax=Leekyejoonella antrihumi TaxID=1660198 RepID=A0A563E147_9MICO|nr:polyketide cyclase [Leekyejoonella antrihumi]
MEFGTIEREMYIDATPDIVFEVVSRPEHVKKWWPDDARYEAVPGAVGEIVFGDAEGGGQAVALSVVDVQPPWRFAFRWTQPADETAAEGNSLLVTFELTAAGDGTLLRFNETGFREMGWEAAVLEEQYNDHLNGWDYFLPRLAPCVAALDVRS